MLEMSVRTIVAEPDFEVKNHGSTPFDEGSLL
jgi:hypothetical protein